MNFKSLHLNIGIGVCFGLSVANLIRDYAIEETSTQLLFMLIPFVVTYMSMVVMWVMIFSILKPQNNQHSLYSWNALIRLFVFSLFIMLPFSYIGLQLERQIFGEVEGFSVRNYFIVYFIRAVFQFGIICLIKYLLDAQELKKNYLEEVHLLKEANSKAQFEILKQQINPHFLFNALSTLKSLIRIQDPNAETFVMNLSDVYRKLLQRREKELIRLSDEMEIVNAYIFMQSLRFENNLIMEINIPPAYLSSFLPCFALQLLIENTIKHNIISQKKPLFVRIYILNDNKIVIENNIQPKKSIEESTGWGLSNIIERYGVFTKEEIEITQNENLFVVKLPLLKEI